MEQEYLKGRKNGLIRVYFYLLSGVNAVSDFRNVIIGIFGLYLTLKLDNPWLMVTMFMVSIIILIPTGYFMVHHVNKIKEWLGTKFGSHYAIQNFDYVKAQYELLVDIKKLLEDQQVFKKVAKNPEILTKGFSGQLSDVVLYRPKKKK